MRCERITRYAAGWPAAAVVVTLLVALSGCASAGTPYGSSNGSERGSTSSTNTGGSGSGTDGSGSDGSGTNGSGTNGSGTNGSGTNGSGTATSDKPTKKPKKKNIIKWTLGLGVGSPEGPAFDYMPSYKALSEGNCAAADDNEQNESLTYVVAAAKACQAAKGGSSDPDGAWAAAKAVRDISPAPESCVDAVVFVLLDSLVTAHDAHPDRQFDFETGGASDGAPRCPEITGTEPESAKAGDVVALRGVNLGEVTGVSLDDQGVDVVKVDDTSVEIRVPESEVETVTLVVESPRNQWQLLAHLKILPRGETDQSGQTDQSPSAETRDGSGG